MKHSLPLIVGLLLVSISFVGVSNHTEELMVELEEIEQPIQTYGTSMGSEWPMYQHDAANTGFSESSLPDSLNLSWNRSYSEITNASFMSPYSSPIIANGKIFIAGRTTEADIFALNENNGSLIWKKNLNLNEKSTYFSYPNSPAVLNGKVFICFGSLFSFPPKSKIFALDENTGDIIWESSFYTQSFYTSVTVSDNKVVVGGHFTNIFPISRLHVFDANNGDLIWSKTMLGYYESTPIISDNTVFVATSCKSPMTIRMTAPLFSGRTRIYVFDFNDGSKKWDTRIQGHVIISSPVISDGKLIIPSNIFKELLQMNRRITSLDVQTGEEQWHYQRNENRLNSAWPTSISTPSVAYGKIFINDVKGLIIALDRDTGDLIWEREIIEDISSPSTAGIIPPVIVDGKVISTYVDTFSVPIKNWICMFNMSNGEKIWSVDFDSDILPDSIHQLTVANEKLFVHSQTGLYVYS